VLVSQQEQFPLPRDRSDHGDDESVSRADQIAHDMRTPLAIILRLCERLADSGLPPREASNVGQVRENVDRLAAAVDELVSIQSGSAPDAPEAKPVDLAMIVRSVCQDQQIIAYARRRRLTVRAVGTARVLGDEGALRSLVMNLVDNALSSAPAGGTVRCSVARCSASVILEVADNGPGIPENERDHVLLPRRRGTFARDGGAGLGLSIVRATVAEHGGRLSIQRAREGGASVVIDLPALRRLGGRYRSADPVGNGSASVRQTA
jgi:two-component system, OmpR family, sensor histidine kinase TctE